MVDIRIPQIISEGNVNAQMENLRRYLYQLTEQLNYALEDIDKKTLEVTEDTRKIKSGNVSQEAAQNNFNSIKSLIIKSSDIVNAYYEKINTKLIGKYVAQSEFGVFSNETSAAIEQNAEYSRTLYENLQEISSSVEEFASTILNVQAHIKTGLLYYADDGTPMYGLEIGQKNETDGIETFNKFARFTADKLSFYDQNEVEVAYISDYKLHISNAEITGNLRIGGYIMDTSNGIAFKWVGD